jgi:hypothetical protein
MEKGDHFQYPKKDPFKVPEHYNKLNDRMRKTRFWVKIMQPGLPFEFAKHRNLHITPICWSSEPESLACRLDLPVETIEET